MSKREIWEYAVNYVRSHTGTPASNLSGHQFGMFWDELNGAGKECWECFQILPGTNGWLVFYKRPKL